MNRKRSNGGVQLGLIVTPLLDMSFQLLAFFIIVYAPNSDERLIAAEVTQRSDGKRPGGQPKLDPAPELPVPHRGWSRLETTAGDAGLADGDYVYFAHSFACDDGPNTIARAQHSRPVPAAVRQDNVVGAQFHPERSGDVGARFLQAFLTS